MAGNRDVPIYFKMMGTPLSFFRHVVKRKPIFVTSCLITWRTKSFQNGAFSKEFAYRGAICFPLELSPYETGSKNGNKRVAFLENVTNYTTLKSLVTKHCTLWL